MDSLPSQSSGRFNLESASSSSAASSSSSSPRRENNTQGRRNSSSLNTSSSSKSLFEHNLSSILNNPTRSSDTSWIGWWPSSSSTSVVLPEFAPINTFKPELETSRSDFVPYLSLVSESFRRFEDIRNHTSKENVEAGVDSIGGQGEALVACLREVPALFFKEDFQLEERGTFKAACPFASLSENLLLQERLSQYLDVVEVHLVKEISLRSNSFFEAQRQLEDLNVKVVEGCKRIRELKETIRLLDVDLVDSARHVQELNGSRSNLLSIQQKLRLMLYVNQALSALKLLVTSGDCAGALDVADDLQHLLDGGELTGLHCFRHLRDHVASATDSVNSILSAEFMRESTLYNGEVDNTILLRAKEGASTFSNGRADEVKLDDVETSNVQDHLLPIIIGLLRTAKLPSVLRMYNETLTTEMKIAIKTAVAELLPILLVRPLDSDFSGDRTTDADGGGGSTLASRLRSLSSESFVQLLLAIFKIVLSHLMRAAEVKKSIERIMSNLDGHYAAASVARAIEHGAVATEVAQHSEAEADEILPHPLQRFANSTTPLLGNGNIATSSTNISKNFRADVLRENAEALFAACDAAHGRWAKLLGVRALLHPRLKLQEFLSMYNITQEFMTATEKIGGRVGYTIRGVLQSQAKSFIEFQHESRMAKMKAVLDQETWVEVEVPDEFQAIVSSIHDSDPLVTENTDDSQASITEGDGVLGNSVATVGEGNGHQHVEHRDSNEVLSDNSTHLKSHQLSEANKNNQSDSMTTIVSSNNSNTKDREKSTPHTLLYLGASYHMVNCGLILIKMLSEYIDMNDNLPLHSMEIVRRVVDILKFFNTRTCQLVLGAGAMQVSGLKSITAKHLALASQVISFTFALIPDVRRILFLKVSDARKGLLSSDIDRVAQDYKIHRDEIHTKLVQIMRERLLVHLRGLSQIVESWNRPDDNDAQPSQFARSLTKEVAFLQRVLSRTLHEADVQAIFRQVVIIFHTQITDAFSRFEISTPQAKNRLRRELDHLLACIRSLPSDIASKSGIANWGPLDDFFAQRFGDEDGQ